MAQIVRTADAADTYQRRHGRPWREDAGLGLHLAMVTEVSKRITRGALSIQRALDGERPLAPSAPLPAWCKRELDAYRRKLEAHPSTTPAGPLQVAADPRFMAWAETMAQLPPGASWPEAARIAIAHLVGPHAEDTLRARSGRNRHSETLFALFVGVRMTFYWKRDGVEPKASQLALIAAAAGLESIEEGLTPSTKRWETRRARWSKAMDAHAWRPIFDDAPYAPLMDLALPG